MNRYDALETLRRSERALRERGVKHAALFGSVARGDHRPDSDIDIKDYIASLFAEPVDVVNREGLKPHVGAGATTDAIYAF
jgi:uncharacterized protein